MDFNFSELEDLFFNIKSIIDFFENTKYDSRRFKLYLSNGQYLNFSIPKNCIAHLLGINTTYLTSTSIFNATNSFELLKELDKSAYKIYNLNKQGIIDYNNLFSPFILSKVSSFIENIKLTIQDIEFICKYDKEKTYTYSDLSQECDYIIVKKLQDDNYGLLYLVRNGEFYAPMSSQIYDNYESLIEKLKEIAKFQEISLVRTVEVSNILDDYFKSFSLSLEEKGNKLNNLKLYKRFLNCSVDVSSDFLYTIQKFQKNITIKDEASNLINTIVTSINNGTLIDLNSFDNSYLLPIVSAFNDFICSNEVIKNTDNSIKYSEIIERLRLFEEEIKNLKQEKKKLEEEKLLLSGMNDKLSEENSQLNKTHNKIYEILKGNCK